METARSTIVDAQVGRHIQQEVACRARARWLPPFCNLCNSRHAHGLQERVGNGNQLPVVRGAEDATALTTVWARLPSTVCDNHEYGIANR